MRTEEQRALTEKNTSGAKSYILKDHHCLSTSKAFLACTWAMLVISW